MPPPPTAVDYADLHSAAGHVRDAARDLDSVLKEVSQQLTSADSTGWATVVAMGAAASTVGTALTTHLAAINAYADELDLAAREYSEADRRGAGRLRGD